MNNDIFDDVYVNTINTINDSFGEFKKLSDFGDNWDFDSKCPKCNRLLVVDNKHINKLTFCRCGQKIYFRINPELI